MRIMNGNKAADTEQFSFSQQTRRRILTEYVECLYEACQVLRFPARLLDYSNRELQLAVDEAEIDIRAMLMRRSVTHGVAAGKLAGVVAYRLARFKIVQISEHGWEQPSPHIHMIQELAALFLARRIFIYDRRICEGAVLELAYQLSRRHANQETLGAFFHGLPRLAA